jgi:hypothetical protein
VHSRRRKTYERIVKGIVTDLRWAEIPRNIKSEVDFSQPKIQSENSQILNFEDTDNNIAKNQPWESLPISADHKEILKLWLEGRNRSEIADRLNFAKRSITNVISKLRKEYGEEIVPYNKGR